MKAPMLSKSTNASPRQVLLRFSDQNLRNPCQPISHPLPGISLETKRKEQDAEMAGSPRDLRLTLFRLPWWPGSRLALLPGARRPDVGRLPGASWLQAFVKNTHANVHACPHCVHAPMRT